MNPEKPTGNDQSPVSGEVDVPEWNDEMDRAAMEKHLANEKKEEEEARKRIAEWEDEPTQDIRPPGKE